MQRLHQAAALGFVAFSAFIVWQSWGWEYYTKLGPGAGFFPRWLGALLGALALVWLVQVSGAAGRPKDDSFLPPRSGTLRILTILAALVAVAGTMELLGFQLAMFLFLGFLLLVVGRQKVWLTLVIALLGSVGVYHLFGGYLDVQLPAASVEWLARVGL